MAIPSQFATNSITPITVTITNGTTTSSAANLFGSTACALVFPATLTGTSVSFEGSIDGGATFLPVYDTSGTEISVTFVADSIHALDSVFFAPYDQLKVVSNASEGADRNLIIKPCM